jgi:hypothetical protein
VRDDGVVLLVDPERDALALFAEALVLRDGPV